eukprot:scaffold5918_cov86-Skeletonema_dohrnii-CCMP3373.AAC.6
MSADALCGPTSMMNLSRLRQWGPWTVTAMMLSAAKYCIASTVSGGGRRWPVAVANFDIVKSKSEIQGRSDAKEMGDGCNPVSKLATINGILHTSRTLGSISSVE